MSVAGMDFVDPAVVATPAYFAAIAWERRVCRRRRAAGDDLIGYDRPDSLASLGMGLVSILTVGIVSLGVFALTSLLWRWRLVDLGNGVVAWTVGMIAWDFAYYWVHRTEHEVRWLWAIHVNHHSSERYNLTTALRQPWLPLGSFVFFPPLALIGVRPWIVMTCGGINLIYQFWVHTEVIDRMPRWFEFVFNTPSHHRVHHGSNQRYLDKNHGGILILWDRLFGTFEPEVERVRYGLTKNIHTYNLWRIFSHEWAAIGRDVRGARSWRDRFLYVWAGPGWRPTPSEGSPLRS